MRFKYLTYLILFTFSSSLFGQEGQISFDRVELMPNEPSPYLMRDWFDVAKKYDSFVYDINLTGEHLPLVFINAQGNNYPSRESFGLHTYVGTVNPQNGEGINVLPSLVSASLVGIDKTDQYGKNWILMSQDFFNLANGENIYLNNTSAGSGGDWWYDMMPNVFFYQLYDLYGPIGDAGQQFIDVADQMAASVAALGGSATPWTRGNFNYRAFDFVTMQPNPNGVHEPEASGAYAWLLYHAFNETGNIKYLQAAEWSMEFLSFLGTNPSYELQLPYGAYTAARMNAEIGTEYDVEKMLFWVFNRGPLRGWGTIVGNWGGVDVSGLVGEANDGGNDYAFQLNGVQQAATLVPLARYDKRYARSIAKWFLNVANATRLMFPGFLPSSLQDASEWSQQYDPDRIMGYEALREVWMGNTPFATGDALRGGWAATNLSLYSTSSIGYMGSLMSETDVPKILKLDLLKTDFFREDAYPSYLYFNPYTSEQEVSISLGDEPVDIYNVLSETFIAQDVSGEHVLNIPADEAISIVLCPPGGTITYENNKMLINDVVIDFRQSSQEYNYPPRIQAFATENTLIEVGDTVILYAKGIDQETKDLTYRFILPDEEKEGLEKTQEWIAPESTGTYEFTLIAFDSENQSDTTKLELEVVEEVNIAPEILELNANPPFTNLSGSVALKAVAIDENQDMLEYNWSPDNGSIDGSGAEVIWNAPMEEGIYSIQLSVTDSRGGSTNSSISIIVIDPDNSPESNLILWYPFNGNSNDESGNDLDGSVFGAKLSDDKDGNSTSAYFFDGNNDHIQAPNNEKLDFNQGITVSLFANAALIGDRERFLVSHGSWQNRWKLSITPEKKLRWTIKNSNGQVTDLDSEIILEIDRFYHFAATYNGSEMLLYIDGTLNAFKQFNGALAESPFQLEVGQMLPDDPGFNFRGVLDEIRIYDQALQPDSIYALAGNTVTNTGDLSISVADFTVYPNPSSKIINIDLIGDGIAKEWSLNVINSKGYIIRSIENLGRSQILNISELPSGMYFLMFRNNSNTIIKKITKI